MIARTSVAWDTLALELARDAYLNHFPSRRGVWELVDDGALCLYNNNPYADVPEGREWELAAFRRWLRAEGIGELAYSTYPPPGEESAGYTYAMLLDASGEEAVDRVIAAMQQILTASWAEPDPAQAGRSPILRLWADDTAPAASEPTSSAAGPTTDSLGA